MSAGEREREEKEGERESRRGSGREGYLFLFELVAALQCPINILQLGYVRPLLPNAGVEY